MKQILFIALTCFFAVSSYAQDEQEKTAVEYRNDGVNAYKTKDYAKSLEAFEKSWELSQENTDVPFFAGVAAINFAKTKKDNPEEEKSMYEKAISFFDKSIELKAKGYKPYVYKATAQQKISDYASMEKTLDAGIEAYPAMKSKFNKLFATCYFALGLEHYNTAVEFQQKASDAAKQNNADKMNAELKNAKKEFEVALPYMENSYKIDPKKKNTLTALKNIYESMEMKDKAKQIDAEIQAL